MSIFKWFISIIKPVNKTDKTIEAINSIDIENLQVKIYSSANDTIRITSRYDNVIDYANNLDKVNRLLELNKVSGYSYSNREISNIVYLSDYFTYDEKYISKDKLSLIIKRMEIFIKLTNKLKENQNESPSITTMLNQTSRLRGDTIYLLNKLTSLK
jgi:hypothetical protein